MPEDVDIERFTNSRQRDIDDRAALHHPGIEYQDIGVIAGGVLDIDLVEEVELDDLHIDARLGGIGAQTAYLRPGLRRSHHVVSKTCEFDSGPSTEAGTRTGNQDLLRHAFPFRGIGSAHMGNAEPARPFPVCQ